MPNKDIRYYAHTIRLKLYGFFYAFIPSVFYHNKELEAQKYHLTIYDEIKHELKEVSDIKIKETPFWVLDHAFPKYNLYAKHIHFDQHGIAMCRQDVPTKYYNPLICAQIGLIAFNNFLSTNDVLFREIAINQYHHLTSIKQKFKGTYVWYYESDYPKFGVKAPWYSGITQGVILSFFIRIQSLGICIGEGEIDKIADAMFISTKDGGVYSISPEPWIEEYPSHSSNKVLNGFIFSLIGLHEYYIWKENQAAKENLLSLYHSLFFNLYSYLKGDFIKYCRTKPTLSNIEYMPIYTGLLLHLYKLTYIKKIMQLSDKIDQSYDHAQFDRMYF